MANSPVPIGLSLNRCLASRYQSSLLLGNKPKLEFLEFALVFLEDCKEPLRIIVIAVFFTVAVFVPEDQKIVHREQEIQHRQHGNLAVALRRGGPEKSQGLVDLIVKGGSFATHYR